MKEKLCDRGCGTMIHFEKVAGKFVPLNPDGSQHKCKDGKVIPTAVPTINNPRMIARVERYDQCSVTLTIKGGEKIVQALTKDRYAEFQKAAILIPAENHPDAWIEYQIDKQGFVLAGWKIVQAPDWAKEINTPIKEKQDPEPEKPPVIESPQMSDEDRIRQAVSTMMPSDRVGCRISLLGCVNSVIEMKKVSGDAPKTYAELEEGVKRDAVRLFLWIDGLTTKNVGGK